MIKAALPGEERIPPSAKAVASATNCPHVLIPPAVSKGSRPPDQHRGRSLVDGKAAMRLGGDRGQLHRTSVSVAGLMPCGSFVPGARVRVCARAWTRV